MKHPSMKLGRLEWLGETYVIRQRRCLHCGLPFLTCTGADGRESEPADAVGVRAGVITLDGIPHRCPPRQGAFDPPSVN